jgi:hypothetical protein
MLLEDNSPDFGEIYCDMDGVLVDFESGAIDLLTAVLDGTADPMWTATSKSVGKNIQKLLDTKGDDWRPRTKADLDTMRQVMMSVISSNPGDFFESLEPLEDGVSELWPFLNSLGRPVHVLSAPINGREGARTAGEGKRSWVEKYLHPQPDSVIITSASSKRGWAVGEDGRPNILVDDKASTIDGWNADGGVGILHLPGESQLSISRIRGLLHI